MKGFKPITKLGDGAFGVVYKVLRLEDNKEYALKQIKMAKLSQKERNNALNQVRILASLNHPNIIGYRDAFFNEDTETLNIVMDYAAKGDLNRIIENHKRDRTNIPEEEIWKILVQVCRGLKCLHSKNIVHRDLKGANVFINQEGNYLLGDLNISKVIRCGMAETQIGTPYYASPEVWQDIPYDQKSDMWSLGCVLYELAALQPPFKGKDMGVLARKVKAGMYNRIPDIYSKDLSVVIGSLLKVSPHLRLSSYDLLEHSLVKKHYTSFVPSECFESLGTMLSTITFNEENPQQMISKLPKPNYETNAPKQYGMRKRVITLQSERLNSFEDKHQRENIQEKQFKQEKGQVKQYKYIGDYTERNPQRENKIRQSRAAGGIIKLPPRPNVSNKVERRDRSPIVVPESPREGKNDDSHDKLYREYLASRDRKSSNDSSSGGRYIVQRRSLNRHY